MLKLIPILLVLTGCAQYQSVVASYTSEAARSTLIAAEYTLCGATLRSVEERYKYNTDPNNAQAKALRQLCYGADEEVEVQD